VFYALRYWKQSGATMQFNSDLKEVTMNHQLLSKVSKIATLVTIVCCAMMSSTPALAQWEDSFNFSHERGCSNKTLSGDYGFASQGVILDVPGVPPGTPFRSVGLAHFDGKGNLTWWNTQSLAACR
jgi:hypothetical protein